MTALDTIRESAAKELLDPEQLRGLAVRYLKDAMRCESVGHHQRAQKFACLAADLLARALELESRAVVAGLRQ